jgi:hypothetical protein
MDMKRPVELRGGSAGGLLMNCLFLKDFETGAEQHWWCGPVSSLQEPAFVPRAKNAPEGDGWIVQVCNRLEEQRSDLLIFDALDIEKGRSPRSTSPSACASACTATGPMPRRSACWKRRPRESAGKPARPRIRLRGHGRSRTAAPDRRNL